MQRLFHFALLGLVGLSLVAQTLRFYADMSGYTGGWLQQAVELGGLFIVLGTIAAFFKLMVNLIRSVRRREARVLSLAYGLVLAWPLVLGAVHLGSDVAAQVETGELPNDRHSPVRVPQQRTPEVPTSREFLAGEAWARAATAVVPPRSTAVASRACCRRRASRKRRAGPGLNRTVRHGYRNARATPRTSCSVA